MLIKELMDGLPEFFSRLKASIISDLFIHGFPKPLNRIKIRTAGRQMVKRDVKLQICQNSYDFRGKTKMRALSMQGWLCYR